MMSKMHFQFVSEMYVNQQQHQQSCMLGVVVVAEVEVVVIREIYKTPTLVVQSAEQYKQVGYIHQHQDKYCH